MNKERKRRRSWRKISAGDLMALFVLFLILFGFPRLMMGIFEPEEQGAYSLYHRPILPMTSIRGGETVEVARTVTLDFATYEEEKEYEYSPEEVRVTDSYVLTNPTDKTVTVELAWGFDTKFSEELPAITVDGAPFAGTILPGRAMDMTGPKLADFQMYRDYILGTDHLAQAMEAAPEWDAPVTVYHFYDLGYEGEEAYPPMLGVSWEHSQDITLWAREFGIGGTAKGRDYLNFSIDKDAWIFAVGGEPEDLQVVGTKGHIMGQYSHKEVAGLTYELEVYESTFVECLRASAEAYEFAEGPVTPQMLVDDALKRITDPNPGGYDSMSIYFHDLCYERRMIYWVIPVQIPAGGSVTVSGTYDWECSRNSSGDRHGYDIATTLGSNLSFTEQRAVLLNTDPIIITELTGGQNFGFDLEAGVTEVVMHPNEERYYMDLLRNEDEG